MIVDEEGEEEEEPWLENDALRFASQIIYALGLKFK